MSNIHQPGHDEPENPAKSCETTKPEKECPLCGEKTKQLPNHIANHCKEK